MGLQYPISIIDRSIQTENQHGNVGLEYTLDQMELTDIENIPSNSSKIHILLKFTGTFSAYITISPRLAQKISNLSSMCGTVSAKHLCHRHLCHNVLLLHITNYTTGQFLQ